MLHLKSDSSESDPFAILAIMTLIFGGVTEHMLYQADIPVLMLHT